MDALIGGLEDLQKKAESLGAKMDDDSSDGAPTQSDESKDDKGDSKDDDGDSKDDDGDSKDDDGGKDA